jgi:Resolvase, N terminal domain
MVPTIVHLQRLAACGMAFHSYTEPHLATDNELVRNILLASLAKLEGQKISERTKAGLARARARARGLGGPAPCEPELESGCACSPGQGDRHSADCEDGGMWGGHGAEDQGGPRLT